MTTVVPAIRTECPAVLTASIAASLGSRPSASALRWRVRISSA